MGYKNKIVGIYLITFKTDKRTYKYIGHSINCLQRNKQHLDGLRFNRHDNPIMQRLYNKYGEGVYNFKIIMQDLEPEFLCIVEQCFINMIPKDEKMNIACADKNIFTEEIKGKISVTRKKRIADGSISLKPALEARLLNKKKREDATYFKFTHKETSKTFIENITELSKRFDKPPECIRRNIGEVLNPNSRNKALYGYYIERIS